MSNQIAEVVECPECGRRNRVPAAAAGVPRCGSCQTALPWIAEADDDTYGEVVESSKLPVLLDLWAPWCPPCRMVSPVLEKLAARYAGKVKLAKVNVDVAPRTRVRFGVMSIPTLVVLKDGNVVERQIGAAPEKFLADWLERALTKAA